MAQAFVVGNPKKGKKKSKKRARAAKPKRARKPNPLEAVIVGAGAGNPRGGKYKMAKRKKKSHAGARSRRRRNEPNPRRRRRNEPNVRHRRRVRNPILPVPGRQLPALVGGAIVGGVGSVWVPQLILPSVTGWLSYILNALVAVLGAWGLKSLNAPNAALGFLLGGLTATAGLIIDKVTGKQIIQFSAPVSGMGQFYRQTGAYLPSAARSDLTNAPVVAALPPAAVVTAGSTAAAKAKTMGWSYMRRRAG